MVCNPTMLHILGNQVSLPLLYKIAFLDYSQMLKNLYLTNTYYWNLKITLNYSKPYANFCTTHIHSHAFTLTHTHTLTQKHIILNLISHFTQSPAVGMYNNTRNTSILNLFLK